MTERPAGQWIGWSSQKLPETFKKGGGHSSAEPQTFSGSFLYGMSVQPAFTLPFLKRHQGMG